MACAPQLNATRRRQGRKAISEQVPKRHSSGRNADATQGEGGRPRGAPPHASKRSQKSGSHDITAGRTLTNVQVHSDLAALAHWEPLAARPPPDTPLLPRTWGALVRADGTAPPKLRLVVPRASHIISAAFTSTQKLFLMASLISAHRDTQDNH